MILSNSASSLIYRVICCYSFVVPTCGGYRRANTEAAAWMDTQYVAEPRWADVAHVRLGAF